MGDTGLPENGGMPEAQPTPVPDKQYFTPTPAEKQKTDTGFVVLGFFTTLVLNVGTTMAVGLVSTLLADATGGVGGVIYSLPTILAPLLFVAVLVSFFVGRQQDNVRLKSFGQGGLIFYAVSVLLGLLLFGSCIVLSASGGLF